VGNRSSLDCSLIATLNPPPAPTLTRPTSGALVNTPNITVAGRADLNTEVLLYRNGAATGNVVAVDAGDISSPITATTYDNLPSVDGTYHYRVSTRDSANNESELSGFASAVSDRTPPRATLIQYLPTGPVDPTTGKIGLGLVNLRLRDEQDGHDPAWPELRRKPMNPENTAETKARRWELCKMYPLVS